MLKFTVFIRVSNGITIIKNRPRNTRMTVENKAALFVVQGKQLNRVHICVYRIQIYKDKIK